MFDLLTSSEPRFNPRSKFWIAVKIKDLFTETIHCRSRSTIENGVVDCSPFSVTARCVIDTMWLNCFGPVRTFTPALNGSPIFLHIDEGQKIRVGFYYAFFLFLSEDVLNFSGNKRQSHWAACATCHSMRCSMVALRGMGCCACQILFIFIQHGVEHTTLAPCQMFGDVRFQI
jgi:hypothetical protein